MTFAVKTKQEKQKQKNNLIRSEKKNDLKDKFLESGTDQKKADNSPQTRTPTDR